jgi:hypothetical protein
MTDARAHNHHAHAVASGRDADHLRPMDAPPKPIATPCVQVCIVDGETGLCLGCYRTLGEVARWSMLAEAERDEIMATLPARRSRIRPEKLGLVGG